MYRLQKGMVIKLKRRNCAVLILCVILGLSMAAAEMPLAVFAEEEVPDTEDMVKEEEEKTEEKKSSSSSQKKKSSSSSSKKKSSALTNETIQKNESEISDAKEEKDKLQSGINDVMQILSGLNSQKSDLKNYVMQLDSNLNQIQKDLEGLEEQIEEKREEIEETKKELQKAEQEEARQYADMKKRIRFMYERGNSTYLEIIFSATGIGDFLNRNEYISKIMKYDKELLEKLVLQKKKVIATEERLLKEQEELEELKAVQEQNEESMETLISAKEQEIKEYDSDISNKEQLIAEYEAEIAAQDATIKALEEAIAAEKRRLIAENGTVITYDGGQFTFPCPDYTRISDDYGNRIHPTLGVEQFHNGVDLAAPSGSPILAAYDGTVIAASYSSTMGNYIMLDHGDGLITIYMHASSLLVSNGAAVAKGDKIALVGSTGRSTGPHLHFGVRLNGSYTSPWNYIK